MQTTIQINLKNNPQLSGKNLAQELMTAGFSKKYANEHHHAYDEILLAQKNDNLTRW